MRQTLERADREEAEDSGVVEALTSLARGLQISDTLDSITQSKVCFTQQIFYNLVKIVLTFTNSHSVNNLLIVTYIKYS